MTRKILYSLCIAVLLFIVYLLFNTLRTKPWHNQLATREQQPLSDSAVLHMSQAVQIPTVSFSDSSAIDTVAFKAFGHFIEKGYPLISQRLSKTMINQFSYVFEWKGRNASLEPFILMGHYDVVPVEASANDQWVHPPFSGAVADSCIWGRGSVDDKSGVISILEATEAMLRRGFIPERTIYLCFGHDEEISGRSARLVVDYLAQKNIHAEMVLDEGGEMTVEKAEEVGRPVAAIGVAEKGYASFELSVEKEGGHSMMPPKETAIDILTAALTRLHGKTPPSRFTEPVKELLVRTGSSSKNFLSRMAASNMWLFTTLAKAKISTEPEGGAMIHTTIATTIIEGGIKDNVIPTHARAIINTRILPGETALTVQEFLRKVIGDERVMIKKVGKFNSDPSTFTSTNSPAFKRVESAIYANISHALAAPYLMIGATDSRYYRRISNGIVNFSPLTDSKGFHGINEKLPIRDLSRAVNFIMTIIEESGKEFR